MADEHERRVADFVVAGFIGERVKNFLQILAATLRIFRASEIPD